MTRRSRIFWKHWIITFKSFVVLFWSQFAHHVQSGVCTSRGNEILLRECQAFLQYTKTQWFIFTPGNDVYNRAGGYHIRLIGNNFSTPCWSYRVRKTKHRNVCIPAEIPRLPWKTNKEAECYYFFKNETRQKASDAPRGRMQPRPRTHPRVTADAQWPSAAARLPQGYRPGRCPVPVCQHVIERKQEEKRRRKSIQHHMFEYPPSPSAYKSGYSNYKEDALVLTFGSASAAQSNNL